MAKIAMTPENKPLPLSEEQLAEIHKCAEAATPGPWTVSPDSPDAWWLDALIESPANFDKRVAYTSQDGCEGDAAFIAGSREWIPMLLAEVERLRAQVVAVNELASVRKAQAEAENEELRKAVQVMAHEIPWVAFPSGGYVCRHCHAWSLTGLDGAHNDRYCPWIHAQVLLAKLEERSS